MAENTKDTTVTVNGNGDAGNAPAVKVEVISPWKSHVDTWLQAQGAVNPRLIASVTGITFKDALGAKRSLAWNDTEDMTLTSLAQYIVSLRKANDARMVAGNNRVWGSARWVLLQAGADASLFEGVSRSSANTTVTKIAPQSATDRLAALLLQVEALKEEARKEAEAKRRQEVYDAVYAEKHAAFVADVEAEVEKRLTAEQPDAEQPDA